MQETRKSRKSDSNAIYSTKTKNDNTESRLETATKILREIKLSVDSHGDYYIEDDSQVMEDINKFLSDD